MTLLVIVFLAVLAAFVIVTSILILTGGKFYHKIPAKSRPRRWVVGIFFSYFVAFCASVPVWVLYPYSVLSKTLRVVFLAFTAFIAAWYVLGKVGALLSPVILAAIALVEWIKERSQRRHPPA